MECKALLHFIAVWRGRRWRIAQAWRQSWRELSNAAESRGDQGSLHHPWRCGQSVDSATVYETISIGHLNAGQGVGIELMIFADDTVHEEHIGDYLVDLVIAQ